MKASPKPIPEGFSTVTPHLAVDGAADAIAFYQRAFGAEEMFRMPMPGNPGKLMHAQIRIGNALIMLADVFEGCGDVPDLGATPSIGLHLYVDDCDAMFDRAVKAGATVVMPLMDMFWGDRYGQLADPFGHRWSVATHKHDYTPEQMAKGAEEAFAAHAAAQG